MLTGRRHLPWIWVSLSRMKSQPVRERYSFWDNLWWGGGGGGAGFYSLLSSFILFWTLLKKETRKNLKVRGRGDQFPPPPPPSFISTHVEHVFVTRTRPTLQKPRLSISSCRSRRLPEVTGGHSCLKTKNRKDRPVDSRIKSTALRSVTGAGLQI